MSPVSEDRKSVTEPRRLRALAALRGRPVVLVGLMGAGKTTVGRRLAAALNLPFVDADHQIEAAAGMSISDIFETHGEQYFRDGERRVISRLLAEGQIVLASGGGAFIDPETRELVRSTSISVWLRGGLDLLLRRVSRRATRPLLKSDPRGAMERLINERYPIYEQADITVESRDVPHDVIVGDIIDKLAQLD
jgi:shikimate kinase